MAFFEHQRSARAASRKLLLAFFLTVALVVIAVNGALWLVFWWLSGWKDTVSLPNYFYEVNTGMVLLFVLGGWWLEYSVLAQGGVVIARRVGARELRPRIHADEERLEQVAQEIAIAAQHTSPTIMVLPNNKNINAFAVGLHDDDAAVVITQGALDALEREELQALVAHEFSHIIEGDTKLYTQLSGMAFGLELVFRFGQGFIPHDIADDKRNNMPIGILFGIPVMATGAIGWLAGRLLVAAFSRQREYLADARSVQWTRYPQGLLGVLEKIVQQGRLARPRYDANVFDTSLMARQEPYIAHMLLVSDVRYKFGLHRWLSTHPPIQDRIKRLKTLTRSRRYRRDTEAM